MLCRSCKSKNLKQILNLGSHTPSNFYTKKKDKNSLKKFPLKTYLCLDCYLVQIKDYLKGDDLFLKNYAYLSGVSKTWHEHCLKFVIFCVKNFNLKKNDKVLEIASNDGTLLKYFLDKNYNVLGIEPTLSTASISKKNGIRTITKFFGYKQSINIKKKYGNFRLIIANNVIAHVDDVNDFFKGLNFLCGDKTIISIEFQYVLNLIKNNQFDTIYHEHFSYYSLISLKNLIDKFNFKIFDVKKIPTHGGSLRVFICKNHNKIKISQNYYSILLNEKKIGIDKLKFYLSFQKRINLLRINFRKFIFNNKKKKKSIYAYGAAAKGNTFLNFMNLNDKHIKFIMDKNKKKINRLSPGGLIKIVDPKVILSSQPDYILILAWNIQDEIIKDLKKNYNFKNTFVIAIPDLKEIL